MVKFIWIQLLGCALPTATSEVPLRFPGATVLHCASEKLFVSLSSPWALDWWGLMLMSLCSRSRLFGKVCYDVDDFAGKILGGSRSWHSNAVCHHRSTFSHHFPPTPHHPPPINECPPTHEQQHHPSPFRISALLVTHHPQYSRPLCDSLTSSSSSQNSLCGASLISRRPIGTTWTRSMCAAHFLFLRPDALCGAS